MKIAVLSDVHGNIRALESVLDDAKELGIDQFIFLGDLVFMGLDPQLCYDKLMSRRPLITIKGNTDSNLEEIEKNNIFHDPKDQLHKLIRYCDIRLQKESKNDLETWPISQKGEIDSIPFYFCHGTPYSFSEGLTPDKEISLELSEKLGKEGVSVILCGHTHIPADFYHKGIRIINPGAIGFSFDGDVRASYAILDVKNSEVDCKIRRVDYDRESYIKEVEHASYGFNLFTKLTYALEYGRPMAN